MKRIFLSAVISLLMAAAVKAETVYLKDGSRINGTVVSADPTTIQLQTPGGLLKIDKSTVERIDYEKAPAPAGEAAHHDPAPATEGPAPTNGSFNFLLGQKLSNTESKAGFYAEGDYLIPMSPSFSIGPGIGYSNFDNKVEKMSSGDVTMIPMVIKFRLTSDPSVFFLDGGVGYYLFDHTLDGEAVAEAAAFGYSIDEDLEDTAGGFIGAGFNVLNSPTGTLGFSVHRIIVKPKLKVTATDIFNGFSYQTSDTVDLSATVVSANFLVRF